MTICIFGDSIAWGAVDCEKGGWVERLKTDLMDEDINVYNLGISGETTDSLLERFETEAETRKPDIIIFAIGINDASKANGKRLIKIDEFRKNIEILASKAKRITDKVAFIGLTDVDESKTDPYPWDETISSDNQSVDEYDELIEMICGNNSMMYVQMAGLLEPDELCDGLHPDSIGHQKIFKKIKKELSPLWTE